MDGISMVPEVRLFSHASLALRMRTGFKNCSFATSGSSYKILVRLLWLAVYVTNAVEAYTESS